MSVPYKVGLTGGIGCGKSTVTELFARYGVSIIDADKISHDLTQPGESAIDEISDIFGKDIVDSNGNLDRQKLKSMVFKDEKLKNRLESVLHPKVYKKIESELKNISSNYCILSIPLLLETGAENLVDTILVIDCPEEIQIKRILTRDKISEDVASKIISAQMERESRMKKADDIIFNDSDIDNLELQVQQLHEKYTQLASATQ